MHSNRHRRSHQTPRDTSWNNVARHYDRQVSDEGSDFHRNVILPELLPLLKPEKGENYIDIGCGQGVLCRALADEGVNVTGIDAAPKLIELAKQRSPHDPRLTYRVLPAQKLEGIDSDSFDGATCILAIQNMDPLTPVIKEMARVLRPSGKLALVLNHPCFRIPRQTGWGIDEGRKLQYRRVDSYMSEMKVPIQMHPGAAPDVHTWSFHRPLSLYIRTLAKNGIVITGLEEWISHRETRPGKDKKIQDRARAEIPMFMCLLGKKA